MANPIFVSGNHGDEFPKWILNEIVNWMEHKSLSKLTVNVAARSKEQDHPVTLEFTGYSRTSVARHAPVSIDDIPVRTLT